MNSPVVKVHQARSHNSDTAERERERERGRERGMTYSFSDGTTAVTYGDCSNNKATATCTRTDDTATINGDLPPQRRVAILLDKTSAALFLKSA